MSSNVCRKSKALASDCLEKLIEMFPPYYVHIYIHTHTHTHIYIYICMCVCVCVCECVVGLNLQSYFSVSSPVVEPDDPPLLHCIDI